MSMQSRAKKFIVLGATGIAVTAGLTACTSKIKEAQANIDKKVVNVINADENAITKLGGKISKFTFLSADTTVCDNNKYLVDINGISTSTEVNGKSYTTLNYLVDGQYFDSMDKASNTNVINALSNIVENEKFNSISANKVKNVKALNNAFAKVAESPIKDYDVNKNFLYGLADIKYDDQENVVSFVAKNTTKFLKTSTDVSWGVVGVDAEGKTEFGWVFTEKHDYKVFFIDQKVYIKLSKEEFENSKTDESIIFDKFVEYVNNKEKENYIVKSESVLNSKDLSANMIEEVELQKA